MTILARAIATLGIGFRAELVARLGMWPVSAVVTQRPDFSVHAFARVRAKTSGAKAMASALAARRGHLVTPGGHSIRRRR